MPDRRTPFEIADERTTLVGFLDYLRESVVVKADGLDDAQLRWSPVPTGTSLLGLLRHLTEVEMFWFHRTFAGLDVDFPPAEVGADERAEDVIAQYRAACALSNEVTAKADGVEQRCRRKGSAPEPVTLRWVLVHMIEETGRHAGQADIVRELIDGTTGR